MESALTINFNTCKALLYNGQNAWSQIALYLEVPLFCFLSRVSDQEAVDQWTSWDQVLPMLACNTLEAQNVHSLKLGHLFIFRTPLYIQDTSGQDTLHVYTSLYSGHLRTPRTPHIQDTYRTPDYIQDTSLYSGHLFIFRMLCFVPIRS